MSETGPRKQQCEATKKDGAPCTNWAKGESAYCRHHQDFNPTEDELTLNLGLKLKEQIANAKAQLPFSASEFLSEQQRQVFKNQAKEWGTFTSQFREMYKRAAEARKGFKISDYWLFLGGLIEARQDFMEDALPLEGPEWWKDVKGKITVILVIWQFNEIGEWQISVFEDETALSRLSCDLSERESDEDSYRLKIRREVQADHFVVYFQAGQRIQFSMSSDVPVTKRNIPHPKIFTVPPEHWFVLEDEREPEAISLYEDEEPEAEDDNEAPLQQIPQSTPSDRLEAISVVMPEETPIVTAEEVRILTEAIANGRTRTGWEEAQGGAVRVFRPRPHGHEVRLRVANPRDDCGTEELDRELNATLDHWALDEALLTLLTVGTLAVVSVQHAAAIVSGSVAPVIDLTIDEILSDLYPNPFSSSDARIAARQWVRRTLIEVSGTAVVGSRRGIYPDPETGKKSDTYQEEGLFFVNDAETTWEGQQLPITRALGNPIRLRIHGGGLFQRIASNPKMLQYLGVVQELTKIPGGKVGGMWARSAGLASAHRYREEAAKSNPNLIFKRRELLERFPPKRTIDDIARHHPKDVLDHWKTVRRYLIRRGFWVDFDEPSLPSSRYDWIEEFKEQEIQPPPGPIFEKSIHGLPSTGDPLKRLRLAGEEAREAAARKRKWPNRKSTK